MAERQKKADRKYDTKTEGKVKSALLELMARKPVADITISELARTAGVSRSTFYEHYGNPADVYDDLVADLSREISPLMEQLLCSNPGASAHRPFCERIRATGDYAPLVREGRFMDTFLGSEKALEAHDICTLLAEAGYTAAQARAVAAFQMSGCFSASRTATDDEWSDIRPVIDRFILGGISACLAAKKQPKA